MQPPDLSAPPALGWRDQGPEPVVSVFPVLDLLAGTNLVPADISVDANPDRDTD